MTKDSLAACSVSCTVNKMNLEQWQMVKLHRSIPNLGTKVTINVLCGLNTDGLGCPE